MCVLEAREGVEGTVVGEPGGQLGRLRGRPGAGERGLGPEGGREGGQGQEGFLGGQLSAAFARLTGRVGTTHREGPVHVSASSPSASGTSRPGAAVLGEPGTGGRKWGALAPTP